ncbi:Tripartite tricarboxylate transporter family receptor [compost metagenome]
MAKLADHAARALKQPNVVTQYAGLGAKPVGSDPATFARFNVTEGEKWRDIVKAAQIVPQ